MNFLGTPNKIRKDNFGNEIKKWGKQKIVFADEIKVAESLIIKILQKIIKKE